MKSEQEVSSTISLELKDSSKPIVGLKDSFSNAKDEVKIQKVSLAQTIENSFEKLHCVLETHKQQMLKEAKKSTSKKLQKLAKQKTHLEAEFTRVSSIIEYAEQCVRYCCNSEVEGALAEMNRKIEKLKSQNKEKNNFSPVVEPDMMVEVNCSDALQELCKDRAKIKYPSDCLVVDIKNSVVKVNKESEILVFLNTAVNCELKFQCYLKSLVNGEIVETTIEEDNPEEYYIVFTPKVRGRHELFVTVNNRPAVGSPFIVLVSSICNLESTIMALDYVPFPTSIASTSKGELVVASQRSDLIILNNGGKRIKSIDQSVHEMKDLHYLAVDSKDVIYFINYSNQIGILDMNSGVLNMYDINQIKGPGHICVSVYEDEVLVTEHFNASQIVVYDKSLQYKRCITGRGNTEFSYFSINSEGNIYINDGAHNIQVFSNQGILLLLFSCSKCAMPMTITVFNHYVYISDFEEKCIFIYSTCGNFTDVIGAYGDIYIDPDGFLYICNYYDSQLLSF